MSDYGLKIAKAGFTAATAANKDLAFNSALPCLKIIQVGKNSAVDTSNVTFNATVAFPIVVIAFLYDSVTSEYEPIEVSFDSTTLYLPGGEAAGSFCYYFICYA